MRRNFILLAALAILSMTALTNTAISFPQITSTELIRPYCNATKILEVFLHDVVPFQSCAPAELTQDAAYCVATTILKNAKNMSCADGATTKPSLDSACGGKLKMKLLVLMASVIVLFGFFFYCRMLTHYEREFQQRIQRLRKKEPSVKKKVRSCIKKFESSHGADQSNLAAHTIPSNCYLLIETFDELERHPEIFEDRELYDCATLVLMAQLNRINFMKIPTDEEKVAWLKKRCNWFM